MENKLRKMIDFARKYENVKNEDLLELFGVDDKQEKVIEQEPINNSRTEVVVNEQKANKFQNKTKRRTWTSAEDSTLMHLSGLGRRYSEIGVALDRSESSVASRARTLRKNGKLKPSVLKRKYLKEEIDLIDGLLKKYGRNVTEIPREEIIALSQLTNRTTQALMTRLYKQQTELNREVL